ncbi:MAG TPA: FecR domain-containing protein, partial [Candidatus Binataceae bacterium]|nr:FecR domain-containing protein [Candidatus Binataceae bacterium]
MNHLRRFGFGAFVAFFMTFVATAALADDPPSRVARLSFTSGEVSMQPGGVNDWAAAVLNRPFTTADRLWTDQSSRAELQLGGAAVRMESQTSLTFTNVADNVLQLELDQGTLDLHVGRLFNGEIYEVDTPNAAFTVFKPGDYRFDVDSKGDATLATVWKGKLVATGQGPEVDIDSHHQAQFSDGQSMLHRISKAPKYDGFDDWCRVRDEREARVISARYVSPDVIGY